MVEIEPGALHMLHMCSSTEPYPISGPLQTSLVFTSISPSPYRDNGSLLINKDHIPKDTVANLHSGPRPTKQGRGIKRSQAGTKARGKPPTHTN